MRLSCDRLYPLLSYTLPIPFPPLLSPPVLCFIFPCFFFCPLPAPSPPLPRLHPPRGVRSHSDGTQFTISGWCYGAGAVPCACASHDECLRTRESNSSLSTDREPRVGEDAAQVTRHATPRHATPCHATPRLASRSTRTRGAAGPSRPPPPLRRPLAVLCVYCLLFKLYSL